ncbi:helix-turn-helix domain-containing protein [Marinobacter sediminicola]|uniref:helix-turn-helix domain-containing protein n=1 Tax=Marinobacter sediminicola TaxID=3072994 RepID=UPI002810EFA5|nr:helix-turn-helix domain-containing protein [Marinobacter sp. F26243]
MQRERRFKMTVVDWLVSERLRRGQELLESTSLSVEAIAERIGFHTATSFRQHFEQRHYVSPRGWRRTFVDVA